MDDLYDFECIKKYQRVSIGVLPAHMFGTSKWLNSLRIFNIHSNFITFNWINTFQQTMKPNETYACWRNHNQLLFLVNQAQGKLKPQSWKFFFGSNSTQMAQQMINETGTTRLCPNAISCWDRKHSTLSKTDYSFVSELSQRFQPKFQDIWEFGREEHKPKFTSCTTLF